MNGARTSVGPPVRVWWRDDDAGRFSPRLDPLLALADRHQWPLALATVPAWLDDLTIRAVEASPMVTILQHGFAHANHAPAGAKPIELGGRAVTELGLAELARGAERLRGAFAQRCLPVLVPPWNRIEERMLEGLRAQGFTGLSTFAADRRALACGLVQVNTHIDVIDWRGDRRMKPLPRLIGEFALAARDDASGPIGVLSHHLVMSVDEMARLGQFFSHMAASGRCRWVAADTLFASSKRSFDAAADRRS